MKLVDVLPNIRGRILAIVGAGGKSSFMFSLAKQVEPPIVVTTTTHLSVRQSWLGDQRICVETVDEMSNKMNDIYDGGVSVICRVGEKAGRVSGFDPLAIDYLIRQMTERKIPVLIEADGSRGLPIKAPACHEPNIPQSATDVVVIVGLDAIGKPLSEEWVFRVDLFSAISGCGVGEPIQAEHIVKSLLHPEGGLKNISTAANKYVFINKADQPELIQVGETIASQVVQAYDLVMVGQLNHPCVDNQVSSCIGIPQ